MMVMLVMVAAMAQSGLRIPRLLVPMGLRRHLQNGCDGGDRVEGQVSRLVLDAFQRRWRQRQPLVGGVARFT